jgi:hypothetical protein
MGGLPTPRESEVMIKMRAAVPFGEASRTLNVRRFTAIIALFTSLLFGLVEPFMSPQWNLGHL